MSETSSSASIDTLLDQAIDAVNRGDLQTAHRLAERVLVADAGNPEASDLLAAPPSATATGELRRLTIMFCDLVGSTALSARHGPEPYRQILGRYKETCRQIVEGRYDGHIAKVKGDGLLVMFGHPVAHEDDVTRAVRAGLDVVAAVRRLSEQTEREVGELLSARVGVHRGLVYLDREEDDIYGLAANVAARLQELASPGSLVISDAVRELLANRFDTRGQQVRKVKGVASPLKSWRVLGERPGGRSQSRGWSTPLVGRGAELERLRQMWRTRPGGVVVRGEAGMGKSRLVGALAAEVEADGATVVDLLGSPFHQGAGFHPLRDLAEQSCGIGRDVAGVERLGLLRQHLDKSGLDPDELVPLLGPVLGLEPGFGYDAAASDARKLQGDIADAMVRYLRSALGEGPALLVVDDIQWFDDSTRDLVLGFMRSRQDDLLVVTISRDATGAPSSGVEVVELGPLPEADCVALVAALDPAGESVTDRETLLARADGVPLYLEELVRAELDPSPGDEPEETAMDAPETAVPDVLYEPLLARLQASAAGARVAAAAATIGRDVDRDLLDQVADIRGPELEDGLAALLAGMILVPQERPGEHYRFRHELLREVAYELQPPSARRTMHSRVADALAAAVGEAGTTDWLTLADHYDKAARPVEALDSYHRAADDARRRGALAEARTHLSRAVDLVWALPGGPRRASREVALRLQRGFLAASSEGYASGEAGADYERCLVLAMRHRSLDDMVVTLNSLWGYYTSRADLAHASQVLELLRGVLTDERQWLLAENEAGFGMLDWFGGHFREALTHLEHAVATMASRQPDGGADTVWFLPNDPLAAIYAHLALARFVCGNPTGATDALAVAERMAAEHGFPQGPFSAAYSRAFGAWMHLHLGDFDQAEALVESTLAVAATHGFDFWALTAMTQRTMVAVLRECRSTPFDREAMEGYAASLSGQVVTWQVLDTRLFLSAVLTTLGAALAALGDTNGARARLDESLALSEETGARFYDAETLRVRAGLFDDADERARSLTNALDLASKQGVVVFHLRIARDLYLLHPDAGRSLLADALGQFATGASYPELDAARSLLADDA